MTVLSFVYNAFYTKNQGVCILIFNLNIVLALHFLMTCTFIAIFLALFCNFCKYGSCYSKYAILTK